MENEEKTPENENDENNDLNESGEKIKSVSIKYFFKYLILIA